MSLPRFDKQRGKLLEFGFGQALEGSMISGFNRFIKPF
jgi:hypothetical protein